MREIREFEQNPSNQRNLIGPREKVASLLYFFSCPNSVLLSMTTVTIAVLLVPTVTFTVLSVPTVTFSELSINMCYLSVIFTVLSNCKSVTLTLLSSCNLYGIIQL